MQKSFKYRNYTVWITSYDYMDLPFYWSVCKDEDYSFKDGFKTCQEAIDNAKANIDIWNIRSGHIINQFNNAIGVDWEE